jgi:hypothetical protein
VFLTAGDAQAARTATLAAEYLRIMSVMFVFMGVLQVMLGAFRGAGDTTTSMAFSLVTLWLARVPTTYYLVFVLDWGPTGIWIAVVLGDVVGAIAATLCSRAAPGRRASSPTSRPPSSTAAPRTTDRATPTRSGRLPGLMALRARPPRMRSPPPATDARCPVTDARCPTTDARCRP